MFGFVGWGVGSGSEKTSGVQALSMPAREITEKNGHFDRNAVKWRNPYKHISENV
jgi:hypothetical protein